jgi:biotin carboxylase
MPFFTRGLAEVGANVIGMGDQPEGALPEMTRRHLAAYVQVRSFADEGALVDEARRIASKARIDRIECLWEPLMIAAARMREALGLPGMTVAETIPFRDKERMKQVLDAAGIRTPRHANAYTVAQVREGAAHVGYPLVVKPIAGAGSADTYRIDDERELEAVIPRLGHVPEVSVEEFVEGEDYTFDTICVDGRILYSNISFYRPRALESRNHEWISQQTLSRRDVDSPAVASGREMGIAVLKALGFETGFTHMEWYRKPSGEAVFGEIGARSPGARTVDVMNFASDLDLFRGWAEAVCWGKFTQPIVRKYNSAAIFKRARGEGVIRRYEGLDRLLAEIGQHICAVELSPIGAPKKDWRKSVIADGFVMLRHPDLATAMHLADRVGTELQLVAG